MTSVWHYTDSEGLKGIVESNVLFATSHRFMNDSREPRHAMDALNRAAAEVRESIEAETRARFDDLMRFAQRKQLEVFLLCAARKPDLLTVWRGYGSAISYALELDPSVELWPVEQVEGDSHPSPPSDWGREVLEVHEDGTREWGIDPDAVSIEALRWVPVQYDLSLARQRVEHIAKLARQPPEPLADLLLPWLNLGNIDLLQLKHEAFEDEREARSIFEVAPRWKFVKHRPTRFGMTPYIELSSANEANRLHDNMRFVSEPARLPIRSVMVGPSPLGRETVSAVREFLESHGYPDVPVSKSTIPFR